MSEKTFLEKTFSVFKPFIEYMKDIFKNTRGVRIVKCRVDENGNKIVEFQALGSFHTEEMDYEEYKKILIYDTEPIDVEKVALFFYANSFKKYKIYSYDPINSIIEISDINNTQNKIQITGDNWAESVKYLKYLGNSDLKHVIQSISSFETNSVYNSCEENDILINNNIKSGHENENTNQPEMSNVINLHKWDRKNEVNTDNRLPH